jgi:hypothetical protein
MQGLLRRFAAYLYARDDTFVARWRRRRMLAFQALVRPPPGARIIDLGGRVYAWRLFEHDYDITLVNPEPAEVPDSPRMRSIRGDARDLTDLFADQSFDVAFSNSTIEHIGDAPQQARFASEVRRLAPAWWVQTPSPRFPVEAHTGVPFYWRLPPKVRAHLHDRWRRDFPEWTLEVERTVAVSRRQLTTLFPHSHVHVERVLGMEKSLSIYKATPH